MWSRNHAYSKEELLFLDPKVNIYDLSAIEYKSLCSLDGYIRNLSIPDCIRKNHNRNEQKGIPIRKHGHKPEQFSASHSEKYKDFNYGSNRNFGDPNLGIGFSSKSFDEPKSFPHTNSYANNYNIKAPDRYNNYHGIEEEWNNIGLAENLNHNETNSLFSSGMQTRPPYDLDSLSYKPLMVNANQAVNTSVARRRNISETLDYQSVHTPDSNNPYNKLRNHPSFKSNMTRFTNHNNFDRLSHHQDLGSNMKDQNSVNSLNFDRYKALNMKAAYQTPPHLNNSQLSSYGSALSSTPNIGLSSMSATEFRTPNATVHFDFGLGTTTDAESPDPLFAVRSSQSQPHVPGGNNTPLLSNTNTQNAYAAPASPIKKVNVQFENLSLRPQYSLYRASNNHVKPTHFGLRSMDGGDQLSKDSNHNVAHNKIVPSQLNHEIIANYIQCRENTLIIGNKDSQKFTLPTFTSTPSLLTTPKFAKTELVYLLLNERAVNLDTPVGHETGTTTPLGDLFKLFDKNLSTNDNLIGQQTSFVNYVHFLSELLSEATTLSNIPNPIKCVKMAQPESLEVRVSAPQKKKNNAILEEESQKIPLENSESIAKSIIKGNIGSNNNSTNKKASGISLNKETSKLHNNKTDGKPLGENAGVKSNKTTAGDKDQPSLNPLGGEASPVPGAKKGEKVVVMEGSNAAKKKKKKAAKANAESAALTKTSINTKKERAVNPSGNTSPSSEEILTSSNSHKGTMTTAPAPKQSKATMTTPSRQNLPLTNINNSTGTSTTPAWTKTSKAIPTQDFQNSHVNLTQNLTDTSSLSNQNFPVPNHNLPPTVKSLQSEAQTSKSTNINKNNQNSQPKVTGTTLYEELLSDPLSKLLASSPDNIAAEILKNQHLLTSHPQLKALVAQKNQDLLMQLLNPSITLPKQTGPTPNIQEKEKSATPSGQSDPNEGWRKIPKHGKKGKKKKAPNETAAVK